VHYRDFGGPTDGPTLVAVHGLGGSALNWAALAPHLTDTYRVLAPDLVGFGLTESSGRPATVPANTEIVAEFVRQVVGGPAIVAGNSMGGMIALHLAEGHPELVAGLVLVDPAVPFVIARPDPVVAGAFAAYAIPGMGRLSLTARRRAMTPEQASKLLLDLCCSDSRRVPADVVAAHADEVRARRGHPTADADFLDAARSVLLVMSKRRRYRELVARVPQPVLLLHGTADRLVPLAAAQATSRSRPDWSFVVLHDIGHAPQLEAPEDTAWTIRDWLAGNGAAAVDEASHQFTGTHD
jgi:pimeloyl-ACP methyl ester carboxylesterase